MQSSAKQRSADAAHFFNSRGNSYKNQDELASDSILDTKNSTTNLCSKLSRCEQNGAIIDAVLVHGCLLCRACYLSVCAQCVCVCVICGGIKRNQQQRARSRVGGTAGLCLLPVRSAQPQTRARRRRLSILWSHSTLTPPTKGAASKGTAEMGQATRRELALGPRSAEASRGRSRWRRGGAGNRETQRRRGVLC